MMLTKLTRVPKFHVEFSKAMDKQGVSQYALAKALGHESNGLIHLVREGKRDVPIDELGSWLDQLELPADEWGRLYKLALRESAPMAMQELMKEVDEWKDKVKAVLDFAQLLTGVDFQQRHLPEEQRKMDDFIRRNNPLAQNEAIVRDMRQRVMSSLDAVLDPRPRGKSQ